MVIYLESLGCARNQVDSEIMLTHLAEAGWQVADDPSLAEVIIVNTCSFIESAADESIDTILALADFKTKGRCRKLIVTGCLPQRYGKETGKVLDEVDLFLGTGAYDQIVAAVAGEMPAGRCLLPDPDEIDIRVPILRKPSEPHAAYLKIAEGCDRRCTFCIIPKLRGRLKSRPPGAIVAEARALIAQGVKEITLVAQETTAYGLDLAPQTDLSGLMRSLAVLDESVWIRFLYGHPQTMTTKLIETVAQFSNLCPYFDIPIQHASDRILRRMGRRYSADDLLRRFDQIRSIIPGAALRTTVLVGFPGETESDVQQLRALMEHVRFDHLGAFAYSDAGDLPSHGLADHVDRAVVRERLDGLMARQRVISEQTLSQYSGHRMTVLVEREDEPGLYVARSAFQAPEVDGCILVRSKARLRSGAFLPVRITDTLEYDLFGEPV